MDDGEEREKERIGRKLKALDREVSRLIDAYQAEVIGLAELKERRERIEEHGRMLKRRLTEIREKRADRDQEIRLVQGLEQFSESIRDSLEEPSFETKQQVLRLVVDRIVVEDARVVVHHVVPTGPIRLQTRHRPVNRERDRLGANGDILELQSRSFGQQRHGELLRRVHALGCSPRAASRAALLHRG